MFTAWISVAMDINGTILNDIPLFDTTTEDTITDGPYSSTFNCSADELTHVPNRTEWSISCNQTLPEQKCRPQEYYSSNYSLIGTLFQIIVFLIGVIGNILVCTVVVKTRSMRTTTNCYLVSLAVADTITLLSSVPQEVLSYHILGDQWVWGSVGCTLMIYLQVICLRTFVQVNLFHGCKNQPIVLEYFPC